MMFGRVAMVDPFQMRVVGASALCRCGVGTRGGLMGEGGPFVPSSGIGMGSLGACSRFSCLRVSVQDGSRWWQRLGYWVAPHVCAARRAVLGSSRFAFSVAPRTPPPWNSLSCGPGAQGWEDFRFRHGRNKRSPTAIQNGGSLQGCAISMTDTVLGAVRLRPRWSKHLATEAAAGRCSGGLVQLARGVIQPLIASGTSCT